MNKQTEYLVLNNQILAYEKYAFERTMLIGFIGFPCFGIMDNGFYYCIPFLMMLLLLINAVYTLTNFKKVVRLKIYMQTILEGSEIYMSFSNFMIQQERYKKKNAKDVITLQKEFDYFEDVTLDKSLIRQIQGITLVFSILYLVISIIFMNSKSSYEYGEIKGIPLSGGLLSILTFILIFFYIMIVMFNDVNVITEKKIAEKVLEEVQELNNSKSSADYK